MTVVGGLIVGIALDKVRINKRTITISMTSKSMSHHMILEVLSLIILIITELIS